LNFEEANQYIKSTLSLIFSRETTVKDFMIQTYAGLLFRGEGEQFIELLRSCDLVELTCLE